MTGKAGERDVHARGVRIRGVTLVGALDFEHATLETPLLLEDVDTADPIILEQATGTWISITDSRVAGISGDQLGLKHSLVLTGTHVDGPVQLSAAHIIGDIDLSGFETEGEVRLLGATIDGNLSCNNGKFRNQDGKAVNADRVEVGGSVFLRAGFEAEGEVRLLGATIGGSLECASGTFHNQDGYALNADSVEVGGSVFLRAGFEAEGEVRLLGATVGGSLDCDNGKFRNPNGYALVANRAELGGSVFLRAGFEAEGEVNLVGATIDGTLVCGNGTFHNQDGYALVAASVRVGGSVFLRTGFEAEGEVNLLGATIGGSLECDNGKFRNQGGKALNGQLLRVRQGLRWVVVSEVAGTVDLSSAHVGDLVDDPGSWEHPEMKYVLEGLTVDRFAGPSWSWRQRKAWLTGKEEPNGPGPYEVVARWYRSVGRDHDARRIAMAKQDARTASLARWRRPLHWLWKQFAGYGYQPLRGVAVLTLVWLWGVWVFSPGRMDPTQTQPVYAFNRWVYSADTVIPLVDFRQAAQWAPGDTFGLVTMWALIAAGWILSLALIAAVSGLYTKD